MRIFAKDPATGISDPARGVPDRKWRGEHTIKFHQHRGISPQDSIGLAGGYADRYEWPGPNQLEYPAVWFDFHTGRASSGEFPRVDFFWQLPAQSYELSQFWASIHADTPGYPQIPVAGKTVYKDESGLLAGWQYTAPDLGTDIPKKYYFRLQREQQGLFSLKNVAMTTWLTFGTTLTYVFPEANLTTWATWLDKDGPSQGTVALVFGYDRQWGAPASCGQSTTGCVSGIPVQAGDVRPISGESALKKSFVRNVGFHLWETWTNAGTVYRPGQLTSGGLMFGREALGQREKGNLSCGSPGNPCQKHVWSDKGNIDDADYWYEMKYKVAHDPYQH